jgi:hypothetical protein
VSGHSRRPQAKENYAQQPEHTSKPEDASKPEHMSEPQHLRVPLYLPETGHASAIASDFIEPHFAAPVTLTVYFFSSPRTAADR